jgi:mono/diheme cytochrome c family protein
MTKRPGLLIPGAIVGPSGARFGHEVKPITRNAKRPILAILALGATVVLAACNQPAPPPTVAAPAAKRAEPAVVARGGELFRQHCAACHGAKAEGAPIWQKAGPDGKYPPPPLNGTAHAWHHPMAALKRTIRDGTQRLGGNMPGWRDKLSDADIEAIIFWFQSFWPDELYRAWQHMDQAAQRGS